MKFGSVTDGYGAAITGGGSAGSYNPADASTKFWYKNNDASGPLVNSISGAASPLIITGTPILQDPNLFAHGTNAVRWMRESGSAEVALATGVTLDPSVAVALEVVVCREDYTFSGVHFIAEIANAARGEIIAIALDSGQGVYAQYQGITGGTVTAYSATAWFPTWLRNKCHIMATWSAASNLIKLYFNGILIGSTATSGALSNWGTTAQIAQGNVTNGTARVYGFAGLIADQRVSTGTVLGTTYARAATKAMGAL
jgi:hypothetical protein